HGGRPDVPVWNQELRRVAGTRLRARSRRRDLVAAVCDRRCDAGQCRGSNGGGRAARGGEPGRLSGRRSAPSRRGVPKAARPVSLFVWLRIPILTGQTGLESYSTANVVKKAASNFAVWSASCRPTISTSS